MSRPSRAPRPGPARRLRGLLFWGFALAALVPVAADCGGDDDDNGAGPGASPCETVYAGQCGVSCSDVAPVKACAAGLFCSSGACTAQCTSEGGCGAGQTCSTSGRCVGGTGAGGTGAGGEGLPGGAGSGGRPGGPGAGGAGGECAGVSVNFQPIIPAIMLVADRSASMRCPITSDAELVGECDDPPNADDPSSRWQTFKNALLPFINEQQEKAIFGVTFYPQGDACGVEAASTVTLRAGGFNEIEAAYDAEQPEGQTPTGAAIASAVGQMNAVTDLPPGTPKFIILASDGSPFCGNGTENAQQSLAVGSVGDAFDSGIRTFVIAIGELFNANPDKGEQFQALADAGVGRGKVGGSTAAGTLYPVTDTASLELALTAIINSVRPCSFDLDKALDDPATDGPRGTVTIDDAGVPFNQPDGWRLVDNDTIEFVGGACAAIRGGSTNIKASFPCDVQTTPAPPPPDPPR